MAITKRLFVSAGGFPEFVAEDVRFSRIIRDYNPRVAFRPTMVVTYSTRRFAKKGFFSTLFFWIMSVWKETPESTYREDYQSPPDSDR